VRGEEEVVFVHSGTLAVTTDAGTATMAAGDTFTTPRGATRAFRALSSDGVVAYVVRGGDAAGPVRFVGTTVAAA
jgi:quercetin dioxygenase-like cupin family protein